MNKLIRSLVLCGSLALFLATRLCALSPGTHIAQYGHTAWRVQDGVLNAAPNVIVQSKDGYIWIGTETGLIRFDGVRFVQWTPPNWDQVMDPKVTTLLAASDGALWIGTPRMVALWKDGRLAVMSVHGYANAMVEDRQGQVWVTVSRSQARQPLCAVSASKVHCFGAPDGIPFPYAGGMDLDNDGNLLIASSSELIHWSPQRGLLSSHSFDDLKRIENLHGISTVETDSDGSALVSIGFAGKGLGLQRMHASAVSAYSAAGLDGSTLDAAVSYRDRSGSLWIGTFSNGLYRVAGSTVEHFTSKEGLSGDEVRDFHEDREGNLWVSTDGGVDFFHDLKVISWSSREGLPSGFVSSVLAARDGSVLIATHADLVIIRDGRVTTLGNEQGLPGHGVTALLEDHSGRFWMGAGNELAIYDGHRFKTIKRPDGQPTGVITALALDADGSVWARTLGPDHDVIHIKDDKVVGALPRSVMGNILAGDARSGVWFSAPSKLGLYSNGKVQWLSVEMKSGPATALVTAPDGSIFSAGRDGVWGIRNGKPQTLGVANGLPCQSVNSLGFSQSHALVLRTACGLIQVAPEALSAWWSGSKQTIPYRLIDSYDGANLSYATFSPQLSLAPDGRLWMANGGAVQVYDPDRVPINAEPPPVHIEDVFADRVRLDASAGLVLPPLTRDIEISYTALSFSVPQKVRFRYMLEGRDATWQDPGTRRSAFYQDLKPGPYRFRVIAANNDGVWNSVGDALDFRIQPAWFQTLWFRVLWITAACLLVWVAYRIRVSYIAQSISARFDERLDERTRMARELHDTFLQTVQGSKMVADDALDPSSDQARMRHALERLSVWLEQAVSEGRAALHALRVSTTERNHLSEFLDRTAREQCQAMSISVSLTVIGDARDLHPIVRDEISRIAEEAIRNTCLHSKASRLHIELRYADYLYLSLRDNGIGIDPDVASSGKPGHFGLQGMKERSARVRGRLTLTSTRNAGTEVTLRVPGDVVYRRDGKSLAARLLALVRKPGSGAGPRHE